MAEETPGVLAPTTRAVLDRLREAPHLASHLLAVLDGDTRAPLLPEAAWNTALVTALADLTETEIAAGTRVGPYQVTRTLGRGGMGIVYQAERVDGEFERTVALKVARHPAHPEQLVRLRAERQTLLRLDHPAIVGFIDGGTTEDNVPFFLSEHIDGEHLDVHCEHHTLSAMDRIRLMQAIAIGVEAAHAAGVIHADLKPANILVTHDGAPKLCDFGLAGFTESASVGYSLPYAAPEQLKNEPLSTATDVYALGVILYELLTGHPPITIEETHDTSAWLDAKLHSQVTPPSQCLKASGLPRRLLPDLDAVIERALTPSQNDRYPSVTALHDDLDRLLTDHPVTARKTPRRELLEKVCWRHPRRALALAGTLVVVSALLVTLWKQRDSAQRAAKEAGALATALTGVFHLADPDTRRGTDISARELLTAGREQAEQTLDSQPTTLGQVLDVLGESHARLGDLDTAEATLRRAALLLNDTTDEDVRARVHAHLGSLLVRQHRGSEAEPLLLQSLAVLRRDPNATREVGRILDVLGSNAREQGAYPKAREWYTRALAWRTQHLGTQDPDVARTLGHLALLEKREGNYDRAQTLLKEALAIDTHAHGDASPRVARDLANIASILIETGKYDAAIPYLQRVITLKTTLYGTDNIEVAKSLTDLGSALNETGRLDQAETAHLKALQIKQTHLSPTHPSIAHSLEMLGLHYQDRNALTTAEGTMRQALTIRQQTQGPTHRATLYTTINLASIILEAGRPKEAQTLAETALPGLANAPPPALAEAQHTLATALLALQDPACTTAYNRLLELCDKDSTTRDLCETARRDRNRCPQ